MILVSNWSILLLMSDAKTKYYLNQAQQYIHTINPNSLTVIAGRRFGKTDGIVAPRTIQRVQRMPRGIGFYYGATFKQVLGRTLPGTLAALNRLGYVEDRHYFIGRKAPKFMNFALPFIVPASWDHIVHFYNGSIIHLLSQDVKFSANSLTTDWGNVDEGRSVHKEKFTEEVVPTLSGTPGKFDACHLKKGLDIVSDMPVGKQGMYLLDNEQKMDKHLLLVIEGSIAERNRLRSEYHNNKSLFAQKELRRTDLFLSEMRKHLHLFVEYDSLENLDVLGPDYIAQMKRELPPVIFQTSILNKRRVKSDDGFYANLDPTIHYYLQYNNSYIDNLRTDRGTFDMKKVTHSNCLQDGDIDPDQPLFISCDYNANINWVVTAQTSGAEMRTLSSFFTKHREKLRAVIRQWHAYYQFHMTREVIVYYDSTAIASAYADEEAESFIDIIYNELTALNWLVTLQYIGQQMRHNLKHQYIDDALTGRKYLFPRFNQKNNEFLLPAMEMAGVRTGRNGFEKDKSGEKLAETEDDLLEFRTDGTDAWDTLFIGLNFFPVLSSGIAGHTTHFA
jgi:hypothetical protein